MGISTSVGLHCAPRAHKTLGTYPQDTVKFSFSHSNTKEEWAFAQYIGNLIQYLFRLDHFAKATH